MMMILTALKADHDKVKKLLNAILATEDAKKRSALFLQFKTELAPHSRAEEKVLYARLEKTKEGKDEALEGTVEHEVVDRLVEDLSDPESLESDQWSARCRVLQELLEHHIEEEEGDFFKTARKLFDRQALDKMGEEFAAEKRKYGAAAGQKTAAE
jgi:hemerythrin-like domain-containing protein